MDEGRIRILSRDTAVHKRMSSQGCPVYFLVFGSAFGGGIFDVLPRKVLGRPGGHIGDEAYHVLKGTLRVYLPDFHMIKTVRATETLYMPARTTHAPYNTTDEEVSVFTCSAPVDPSKDYHYSQDFPEILSMSLEDRGQQKAQEPKIFSLAPLLERRKNAGFVREVYSQTANMLAAALILAPGEGSPGPIHNSRDTMAYVISGQATLTDAADKSARTARSGEVVHIAPGTDFTLQNDSKGDLQVYYASAVR